MSAAAGRARPILRAAAITYAAELFVLAAIVVSFRLAALEWDPAGFGAYVLARRNLTLLQLALLFGLAIAIPRYTAIALAAPAAQRRIPPGAYVVTGAVVCVAALVPAVALMVGIDGTVAAALFGDAAYAPLAVATAVAGAAAVLHAVAYAGFRGRLEMGAASALQAWNLGVVPLAAFVLFRSDSVEQWLWHVAAAWLFFAAVALALHVARAWREGARIVHARPAARELVRYGAPRVPGDAALAGLFALPPVFVAHEAGLVAAGMVGLAVALVRIGGSLFAPIGLLLLPAAAGRAASDSRGLREGIRRLVVLVGAASIAGALLLALSGSSLIEWYLGDEYAPAGGALRWAAVAIPPFALYVVLRNVLDALAIAAHNTKNLVLALALFCAGWLVSGDALASFVVAIVLLGLLSALDARRVLLRLPARAGEAVPPVPVPIE